MSEAQTIRRGRLVRAEGAYREGLLVTDDHQDPDAAFDPSQARRKKGQSAALVFVDAGRFTAWLAAGVIALDAPEEIPAPAAPATKTGGEEGGNG